MKIFREYRQYLNFLLPPSLDEFVPEDHEVRIINDVVDALDSSLLLGRYEEGRSTSLSSSNDAKGNHLCI
jgi:transposase